MTNKPSDKIKLKLDTLKNHLSSIKIPPVLALLSQEKILAFTEKET